MNEGQSKIILQIKAGTLSKDVDLRGMDFSGDDLALGRLSGRDLSGVVFARVNLSRARLDNSDLTEADLRQANLEGADLAGAKFIHADLTGANLDKAILTRADFSGATVDERGRAILLAAGVEIRDLEASPLSGGNPSTQNGNASRSTDEVLKPLTDMEIDQWDPGEILDEEMTDGFENNKWDEADIAPIESEEIQKWVQDNSLEGTKEAMDENPPLDHGSVMDERQEYPEYDPDSILLADLEEKPGTPEEVILQNEEILKKQRLEKAKEKARRELDEMRKKQAMTHVEKEKSRLNIAYYVVGLAALGLVILFFILKN